MGPTSTTKPKTVPSAGGYKYLGCHAEGIVVRALGDAFFPDDENTIERCVTACYPFKYAGAEYGRECWCGNELKGASKVSDTDFCNMPCAGNREQYCGGIVALNVYVAEDPPSASLVPVTTSGTAILSGKTSSTSVPSTPTSSPTSSSQPSITQAVVPSTFSSSSSTVSASTSSAITSSKANSDSLVLTASSVSSPARPPGSSTAFSTVQTTLVTSAQAVLVSIVAGSGSTMTTSLNTRTRAPTTSTTIIASSSSITPQNPPSTNLPNPPKQTSPQFPATTSPTILHSPTSQKIATIPSIVTEIHTVTKDSVPTALPMLNSSNVSPPTTSLSTSPTSVLPPTTTSITSTFSLPIDSDTGTCIPAYCATTITFLTPGPSTDPSITISPPRSWIWTTVPPPPSFVANETPSKIQPTAPRPESPTSSPAKTTDLSPAAHPPQSAPYTPIHYTPVPLIAPSAIFTASNSPANSTIASPTSAKSYRAVTSYTYATSTQHPPPSVVTVTSFLTPSTLVPTSGALIARVIELKMIAWLAGVWVLTCLV